MPGRGELRREELHRVLRETVEHQRRFNRLQIVGEVLEGAPSTELASPGRRSCWERRSAALALAGLLLRSLIQGVDLEHLRDRSDAGDRLLRKLADAEGERARQLAVEIDRAAAHARDHAGVFGLCAAQADQDDVALGTVHVLQHAENFDVHGSGLVP